jgi:propionyl-CoA carboxylase alpha chain
MLAKVIAHAPDRDGAIRLLDDTLRRAAVHGVTTNIGLLRAVLSDDEFAAGRMHTGLLDQRVAEWTTAPEERVVAKAALAAAIGEAVQTAAAAPVLARIPPAWRNAKSQPRVRSYVHRKKEYAVSYERVGRSLVSEFVPGVQIVDASGDQVLLRDGDVRETYRVTVADRAVDISGPAGAFTFDIVPTFVDPVEAVAAGSLLAPMPATVTALHVEVGDEVRRGDAIIVLEAMKMHHTIAAPADGVVTTLTATTGQQVAAGTVLAVIEEKEA